MREDSKQERDCKERDRLNKASWDKDLERYYASRTNRNWATKQEEASRVYDNKIKSPLLERA